MKSFPSPSTPTVQPLSRLRRRLVFLFLVVFFFCSVPIFVFYAIGYRYNFFDPQASIVATGGLYLSVGVADGEVFLNEEPVRDLRVFRNAMYIQNLNPGVHRLHVQTPGLHTWVKELPVYPFIVTEAEAFAVPVVPQVRPITEYKTSTGTAVIASTSTIEILFAGVSTSVAVIATTSKATSTLVHNSEYDYIVGLFATSSIASTSLLGRVASEVTDAFTFAPKTTPAASTTDIATTTVIQDDLKLYQSGTDVFVDYTGSVQNIPYYFCVPEATLASTSELYGMQVMQGVALVLAATSSDVISETVNRNRICRSTIRIDRQWQSVQSFSFFPSATDLIVMHRTDGIFVTEIDDRSWQNTQALYPYAVDELVIDAGRLYIKRGNLIFELSTVLSKN